MEEDDGLPIAVPTPESVASDFMLEFDSSSSMGMDIDTIPSHYNSHNSAGPVQRFDVIIFVVRDVTDRMYSYCSCTSYL